MRPLSKNIEDWPKSVYTRSLEIRKDELISPNSSFNENRLITYPWPRRRLSSNRPNCLSTSDRKTNIPSLKNLTRYSFCYKTTQLL